MPRPALLTGMLAEIRACRACAADLPLGPRPVLQASEQARLMICGQAPGTKVHLSGKPYDDRSGERLRQWLGIGPDIFYDARRIAIVPMGFCYPGRDARGGDLPPRAECARLWHARLFPLLPAVELTLVIGQYAMAWHLGVRRKATLTETVRAWREFLPSFFPLPHPSWRNTGWLKRNPWFEQECVPYLQAEVYRLVAAPPPVR
jgi:uracil-DNA glycosylase